MDNNNKNILLVSMPFSEISIPSIQLCLLKSYLNERNVKIDVNHLYLKAAEIYGLKNYNFLINSKAGSYSSQMIFSRYVFPSYFNENKEKFKEFYNNNIITKECDTFDFDLYEKKTDDFYNKIITEINWEKYDLIGFSLNYSQFLPSLAISKKIKEMNPDKKIVFGGIRTVGEIGKNILKTFDYIDMIVSGDGEESLYKLAINKNLTEIQNLIYKKENEIIENRVDYSLDLNDLPIIDFNSFYKNLKHSSQDIKQYYHVNSRLPLEISRGCWWNKCTFCNLNIQHKKYREKNIEKIIQEIKFLSDKYKILKFQMIGNTLPLNNYQKFLKDIAKIDKDYTFFIEARADRLKRKDYQLLKKAGFKTIQTGIESFSQNYLKKINKGVDVIDNIAALKFCKENEIINKYNLIIGYPNEEIVDFEQTKKNIELFKQYIDPPDIAKLVIGFGCDIFKNKEEYNIENLDYLKTDKLMFPDRYLKENISFYYTYDKENDINIKKWEELVEEWKKEREQRMISQIRNKDLFDKYVFFYVDGKEFLKIYDKRNSKNVKLYMLDEIERKIFLSCTEILSFKELEDMFSDISEIKLKEILTIFEKTGIIFRDNDRYLSLPICINNKNEIKESFEKDQLFLKTCEN